MKNLYFLTHRLWLMPSLGAPPAWAQAQPQRRPIAGTDKVAAAGKKELPGVTIPAIRTRGNRLVRAAQPA